MPNPQVQLNDNNESVGTEAQSTIAPDKEASMNAILLASISIAVCLFSVVVDIAIAFGKLHSLKYSF